VAAACLVTLCVGAAVAVEDVRDKQHCSHPGDTAAGIGSTVRRPARFIALDLAAAQALARSEGYAYRVICRDGEDLPGILDRSKRRINFGVHRGTVVGYWLG
jgi:hypothetical protein